MTNYNYNLGLMKFLAIIGVVFLHISDGYLLRSDYFAQGVWWWLIFILRVLASASVPIFVMTSGYLTIGKKYTYQKLLTRIILRLFIPYLFLFIMTTWLTGITSAHLHHTVLQVPLPDLKTELAKFFIANGSMHFLIALIGLNTLLPLWNLIFSSQEAKKNYLLAKYLIVLSFLLAGTAILTLNLNPFVTTAVINQWRWLLWVGYFLLGYLIKVEPKILSRRICLILFLTTLIINIGTIFNLRWQSLQNPQSIFSQLVNISIDYHHLPIAVMSASLWVLLLKTKLTFLKQKIWQNIVLIGSHLSLGIYIFHGLVLAYLDVFKRIGLFNLDFWYRPALAVFGLTILTLFISAGLTFIVGLLPVARMLIGNLDKWPFYNKKMNSDHNLS